VDNGSTDNTREIVGQAQAKLKNLHYFFTALPGLHAARHLGMEKAQSEILVYTDDDTEASPTWLEGVADGFSRPDVVMVGGKCLPKFESAPPHWLLKRWTSPIKHGFFLGFLSILDFGETVREIPPTYVIGCNFAIRKQTLLGVGGFHPDSMPEEFLFYRGDGETWVGRAVAEQGWKALYHPQATIYHFVPSLRMTFDYFYRRAFAEGITRSFVHLRRIKNIDRLLPDNSPSAHSWWQRLYYFVQQVAMVLPFHHQLRRVEKKGLRDGFHCHQEQCHGNPELHAWVLKQDWLNDACSKKQT
jgi:glycosyltransferase involved in cell wall biosynthesis